MVTCMIYIDLNRRSLIELVFLDEMKLTFPKAVTRICNLMAHPFIHAVITSF